MCHSKLASTRPSLGVSGTVSPPAELPDYAPTNVGVQSLWHYLPLTANAVAKSNAIFTFRAILACLLDTWVGSLTTFNLKQRHRTQRPNPRMGSFEGSQATTTAADVAMLLATCLFAQTTRLLALSLSSHASQFSQLLRLTLT